MGQKSGPVKTGRAGCEGDSARHPSAVYGGGEDPHRAVRAARRGQYRRAVPARGDRSEPVLPLVERVSRSRQKAPGRRHRAGGNLGRGQGSASGGRRVEGSGRRAPAREPATQKDQGGGGGGRRRRSPAPEMREITGLGKRSSLPVR